MNELFPIPDYVPDINVKYNCAKNVIATDFTKLMSIVLSGINDEGKLNRWNEISQCHNIEAKNSEGWTALTLSAVNCGTLSSLMTTQYLINHKADVNRTEIYGWSILMLVIQYNETPAALDVVRLLVEHGANVNYQLEDNTALKRAIIKNRYDIAEYLLKSKAITTQQPLITCAILSTNDYEKCENFIKTLIKYGAKPNFKSGEADAAALFYSTTFKLYEISELLLNNGADVNLKTKNNQTALMVAVLTKNINLCKLLLKHGADFNSIKNSRGYTALELVENMTKTSNDENINNILLLFNNIQK